MTKPRENKEAASPFPPRCWLDRDSFDHLREESHWDAPKRVLAFSRKCGAEDEYLSLAEHQSVVEALQRERDEARVIVCNLREERELSEYKADKLRSLLRRAKDTCEKAVEEHNFLFAASTIDAINSALKETPGVPGK